MSIKIFLYQLLGKIESVEKIEIQRQKLRDDFDEYNEVDKSEELKEFIELERYVLSSEFKNRKNEIKKLCFKGSKEEAFIKEFKQLNKNRLIKEYFRIKDSLQLKRFEEIKSSPKPYEYRKLKEFIENGNYSRQKEEMLRLVYKGSQEQKNENEYNKLKNHSGIRTFYKLAQSQKIKEHEGFSHSDKLKEYIAIKNLPAKSKEKRRENKVLRKDAEIKSYYKFEKSKELKLYRNISGSYILKRYEELKAEVETDAFRERKAFLKDKDKFKKTDAYKSLMRLKELAASDDMKFYLKFKKSSRLQNFYKTSESAELKRYNELCTLTVSDDFLARKAYLEDPKKWEKSDEYSKEQKYFEMKSRPHLVRYFKYKGTNDFDFFADWEVSFHDDFNAEKLDDEKWSVLPVHAEKTVGQNYSLHGDLHLFTEGKNIQCKSKMVIETRKEKIKGLLWEMPGGFSPFEFEYTSGMATTAKTFLQQNGIFEAKIKYAPVRETVSSFVLNGEKTIPGVYLLEMGAKNRFGISFLTKKGKLVIKGLNLNNLKRGKWYIFTLEKSDNLLLWKINDTVLLRIENQNIDFPLYINLFTLVLKQISENALPVRFQIEWIKCYRKKQIK